jgi:hypothetical protein
MELRDLKTSVDKLLETGDKSLDPYSKAHLYEASQRISKALEAEYVYNQAAPMSSGIPFLFFGQEKPPGAEQDQ